MSEFRKKPQIGITYSSLYQKPSNDDPMYCVKLPLIIVISWFVLSAIVRVTSDSGSKFDQIICYGTMICFVIIMLIGVRDLYRDGQVAAAKRRQWKKGCISAEATILDRSEGGEYDDGYRYHTAPCRLELEMNADQRAFNPYQTIVSVAVSDHIYNRLKEVNTVRIYYMPETPMTFLLEDEL